MKKFWKIIEVHIDQTKDNVEKANEEIVKADKQKIISNFAISYNSYW